MTTVTKMKFLGKESCCDALSETNECGVTGGRDSAELPSLRWVYLEEGWCVAHSVAYKHTNRWCHNSRHDHMNLFRLGGRANPTAL